MEEKKKILYSDGTGCGVPTDPLLGMGPMAVIVTVFNMYMTVYNKFVCALYAGAQRGTNMRLRKAL